MERIEFEVLSACAEGIDFTLQKEVLHYSESDVQQIKINLERKGLLNRDTVTEQGLKELEPYRVKRVVFLAAGFGSRMVPITINTPKPMVRVNGKRIIETLIDAAIDAGISDIYIVRGYLGEQFELLQRKYPTIQLVDNPDYDGTGTISSFYYAKELLENAYVMESDLVLKNPKIIRRYHYGSDFMGTRVDRTDDWYFRTEEDGLITEIGVGGSGKNCYKLIGISYWDKEDGKRLADDIRTAYESPDGRSLPMSFVPFRMFRDQYRSHIMPCRESDIIEIDSFEELQVYDKTYQIHSSK